MTPERQVCGVALWFLLKTQSLDSTCGTRYSPGENSWSREQTSGSVPRGGESEHHAWEEAGEGASVTLPTPPPPAPPKGAQLTRSSRACEQRPPTLISPSSPIIQRNAQHIFEMQPSSLPGMAIMVTILHCSDQRDT